MRTLAPAQTFLRVGDKFLPAFVLEDQQLDAKSTLLYIYLFHLAGKDESCWPSQALLARVCKCCVRSVQGYINRLVAAGYIQIERNGTHNVYRLLLSARVQSMIQAVGADTISPPRSFQETETFQPAHSPSAAFSQSSVEPQSSTEVTTSPMLQGANSAPSDTQILQRQGANSAPYLRNTRIYTSPLSPLPAPNPVPRPGSGHAGGVSMPAAPAKDERGKPASEVRDAKSEFEALFASWPRRQDKFQAERTYVALAHSGKLPPLQTLLDVVARFKAEDRAWRNGFAPNLRFWLHGKRWLDEIAPAVNPGTTPASGSIGSPPSLPTDVIAHAQKLYAVREKHGSAVLSDARKEKQPPSSLTLAADALCSLWPHEDRGKIMSCLVLANIRGISPDLVVMKAQETGQAHTLPVENWFRQVAA